MGSQRSWCDLLLSSRSTTYHPPRSRRERFRIRYNHNNSNDKKIKTTIRKQYCNIIIMASRVVKLLHYVLYFNSHCPQQTSFRPATSSPWSSATRGIYMFIKNCIGTSGFGFMIIAREFNPRHCPGNENARVYSNANGRERDDIENYYNTTLILPRFGESKIRSRSSRAVRPSGFQYCFGRRVLIISRLGLERS